MAVENNARRGADAPRHQRRVEQPQPYRDPSSIQSGGGLDAGEQAHHEDSRRSDHPHASLQLRPMR